MGYAFISYSSVNRSSADAFRLLFNNHNIDTWMAPGDIPYGSTYPEVLNKALKECSCLVLLLTNDSQNSQWVSREVEGAIRYNKTIIPIQLEDVLLNDQFEMYLSINQILLIQKIDEASDEIKKLIVTVQTYTNATIKERPQIMPTFSEETIKVGTIIDGKYKIVKELNTNSNSHLFISFCERNNKSWLVKVINKDSECYNVSNIYGIQNILHTLNHPGIPNVIDIVERKDCLIIVMEYIEGVLLSEIIKEKGAQNEAFVLKCAKQLCDILSYLHLNQIIHNALEPRNILLKSDSSIILTEFGDFQILNHNFKDIMCLSTAHYIAPERIASGQTDQRTDIYSLGATLYSLITGNDPSTPPHIIYPLRKSNPTLSKGFEYIITKCMDQNPDKRYQNVHELLTDLNHIDQITYRLNNPSLLKKIHSLFKK